MSLNKILVASSFALAFAATPASAASVLGISWNPDSPVDFETSGILWEQAPTATIGSTLTGYGLFNVFQGQNIATYGGGTKELTFKFTTTLKSFSAPDINGVISFVFGPGTADVWSTDVSVFPQQVLTAADLANQSLANATGTAANLFLSTAFHGDLVGSAKNFFTNASNGTGLGALDVLGGFAKDNFDTDTIVGADNLPADLNFSSSFNVAPSGFPVGYPNTGTLKLTGNSVNVPEPELLALLGLGLIGYSFNRRKQA